MPRTYDNNDPVLFVVYLQPIFAGFSQNGMVSSQGRGRPRESRTGQTDASALAASAQTTLVFEQGAGAVAGVLTDQAMVAETDIAGTVQVSS